MLGASNNIMLPGDCNSRGREILSISSWKKDIWKSCCSQAGCWKLGAIQGEVIDKTPSAVSSHTALIAASPELVWIWPKKCHKKMPKHLSSHVVLFRCSPPPKLVGLSISDATTSRAPCSLPSRAALCCGASWSSGSCSWIPNLQGVIFFCTSAQRSSLFCSPGRHDGITTKSEMRWHYSRVC